ncbi:MAG TPA: precorrin-3B C(17)-methyltransferase [Rhodocyclaceae bacterium]|nr:precorrin-3B C(17)-methyltransferase [Rhodocyclaceae bacterium]
MNAPDRLHPAVPGGKIMLVGLGPGAHEHLTARARAAIAEADTVIGYVTYIRLVAELLDGKEIVKKSMTEELDRAIEALERARLGRKVALISSGDAGVYGMAGPTFEVLFQAGWTPDCGIAVEIVPGASALNSCAALVGAPLTHDFCAISLSDLLTPWPVIARRLDAAAAADFVVALYNPASGRRTGQIVEAQRLFLAHRRPDTPVAIVKSAYRPKQRIAFTTLARMTDCDIGMLTTVLIGNAATFVRDGLMVTPRGYANKYDGQGGTHAGEAAGRSLSTGLAGWRATIRASGETVAALAHRYRLPPAYIAAALADVDDKGEAGGSPRPGAAAATTP